jgi:ABC-2 type transport system permease protein
MMMTTLTVSPSVSLSASHAHDDVPDPEARGQLTFDGVVRSEWIKLLSLRSIRWSILTMVLFSWAGAALLVVALGDPALTSVDDLPAVLVQSATFGSLFTVLIMAVLGVLSITSEYSSGLVRSTLTAVPARLPVLGAKALVVAAMAFVVGVVGTFGGALIAAILHGGEALRLLADPAVLVSLTGNTIYLVLAALLALGMGTLLRSSAAAISVMVVLLFISSVALQVLMMTGWEWVPVVAQWMPVELGNTLSTLAVTPEAARDLSYWGALGGLVAWAAAALVPAAMVLKTRDAV